MLDKQFIRMSLEEMGIYTYEDYKLKVKSVPFPNSNRFTNMDFFNDDNIIDDIRDIVVEYYNSYQYDQLQGQYISINPSFCHNTMMKNYMCIFPKRSLIETSALLSQVDKSGCAGYRSFDLPPDDFIKQYFRFQELVDRNISYLYPINTNEESSTISKAIIDSTAIIPLKNVAEASQNGNFERIIHNEKIFYIAFPWLYNARTDDYIEICDKYPAEFDYLATTIEKLANASNSENFNFQEDYLKELKEALCNIQISYEKKKSQLQTKGIAAITGIALTCVPFVVPHFFDNFDPALLQTILGGSTIAGSVKLLNDFNDIKLVGREDPFWVIWKWKQKSNGYKPFINSF